MLVKASRYGAGSVAFRYLQAVRFLHLGSRKRQAGGVSWYAPLVETGGRSEEHTSELQSRLHLVCRLLLEKKNINHNHNPIGQKQAQNKKATLAADTSPELTLVTLSN